MTAGTVQAGEEEAWGGGNFLKVYLYPKEGHTEEGVGVCYSGAQWQGKRQMEQTETQDIPLQHQEALLCCACD